jgi:hypothetical protein
MQPQVPKVSSTMTVFATIIQCIRILFQGVIPVFNVLELIATLMEMLMVANFASL